MKKKRKPMENPMSGELAPPPERQFYSVAFLCQMLQQPPEFVHRLMRAAEVQFAYCENGVGLINGADVVKMKQVVEAVADANSKCKAFANN